MTKLQKTQLKLSASIGVLLLVGFVAVFGGVKAYQSYTNAPKVVIENGNYIEAQPVADQNLGALAGPDLPYPWFSFGGVRDWAGSQPMNTATTTICALQGPTATSTLEFASVAFTTSSSTASIITIAKAETAFATTTVLSYAIAVGANAQAEIVASSTYAGQAANIFGASDWLVVGMQGGAGTFSPVGTCKARWVQLSD